ncbi:cellulose synthase, family GT2 [Tribonema minus]|uniref:Cellulose synthase, family GT2 n=1 Tax=Tribonema minus TaxID=303371 RepID=A0A835ZCE1_9STRA|nr:cellulose synthase, family GT2 [Tribonema minus]
MTGHARRRAAPRPRLRCPQRTRIPPLPHAPHLARTRRPAPNIPPRPRQCAPRAPPAAAESRLSSLRLRVARRPRTPPPDPPPATPRAPHFPPPPCAVHNAQGFSPAHALQLVRGTNPSAPPPSPGPNFPAATPSLDTAGGGGGGGSARSRGGGSRGGGGGGGGGGVHTRWLSRGRVNSFAAAAGLRPSEAAGGAYADDAVVLKQQFKPNPQAFFALGSTPLLRLIMAANVGFSALYLYWRATSTITTIDTYFYNIKYFPVQIWAWVFYGVEICLTIGILIGHTQRMFPIKRAIVAMEDLVREDDCVGYNARVAILLPSAGERLDIVMLALLGAMSQSTWRGGNRTTSQMLRIIILDEKRRKGVLNMTAAVYALGTLIRNPEVVTILQAEGIDAENVKGFYDWWKFGGGYARKHLYNDPWLNKACLLLEYMEKHAGNGEDADSIFLLSDMPIDAAAGSKAALHGKDVEEFARSMLQALNIPTPSPDAGGGGGAAGGGGGGGGGGVDAGYVHQFSSNPDLPTLLYYTRKDAGTPRVSPKAGNLNAAIFAVDYPEDDPLIGDATIVVVNDCRHQLNPTFLQRTVPYFFELDAEGQHYGWARVAFVQTPQRFKPDQMTLDDPLGNHAAVQYDVINRGKDGIGAVSSSGHGSLWRVEALRGADVDGRRYADPTVVDNIGKTLGFRSQMLIEDTHTSIDMFRHGWTSRYVNEPGEHLSICTHQPNSIAWRIKQVLRWHQGAVQLLFYKGISYTSFGGRFPTLWHRIYAFDQATYYLQAIPGYILLLMPIIYGLTGNSPFETRVADFFLYFTPYIVTGMLPTVISGSWGDVDANKLQRDEQVWLSTTYVQIYAFLSMLWTSLRCQKHENAWAIKAPTWPLFTVFFGQVAALGGGLFWVGKYGFRAWAQNLISVFASALLCMHALWPMVSLQMGWKIPSMYIIKILVWALLGGFIVLINHLSKLAK